MALVVNSGGGTHAVEVQPGECRSTSVAEPSAVRSGRLHKDEDIMAPKRKKKRMKGRRGGR